MPRGATGFWDHGSDPLPETDPRVFARICHEAARRAGGRVEKITPPGVTPNFHLATLARSGHRLALLGLRHLPLVAIAECSPDNSVSVTFVDDLAVREALELATPFRLLTLGELGTPVSLADLSGLAPAGLRQIASWKPETVGELLFNYWD